MPTEKNAAFLPMQYGFKLDRQRVKVAYWSGDGDFSATLYVQMYECTYVSMYVVLPKNSGNLNRAPKPVVVCPSAARCG